jgi:hypothetical protein
MLEDFINNLPDRFPNAGLRLRIPATNPYVALERSAEIFDTYARFSGCAEELDAKTEYSNYVRSLSDAIGVAPDKLDAAVTAEKLTAAAIGVGLLGFVLAEGTAHAADASHSLDAADMAASGLDIADAATTLGISLGISWLVGRYFKKANREKKEKISLLTEQAMLNCRLARFIMSPERVDATLETLSRMKELRSR